MSSRLEVFHTLAFCLTVAEADVKSSKMVALRDDQVGQIVAALRNVGRLTLLDKADPREALRLCLHDCTLNHLQWFQVGTQPSYEVGILFKIIEEGDLLSILNKQKLRDPVLEAIG